MPSVVLVVLDGLLPASSTGNVITGIRNAQGETEHSSAQFVDTDNSSKATAREETSLMTCLPRFGVERLRSLVRLGHRVVLVSALPSTVFADLLENIGPVEVLGSDEADWYTGGQVLLDSSRAKKRSGLTEQWLRQQHLNFDAVTIMSGDRGDIALLKRAGTKVALNPDWRLWTVAQAKRWRIEHWDRPRDVGWVFGVEPQMLLLGALHPSIVPFARIQISGVEKIPHHGGAILAANHRSLFDAVALAMLVKKIGRPVRPMAKQELFSHRRFGKLLRSLGAIAVDRQGSAAEAYRRAVSVLDAGELLLILPEGTISGGSSSAESHRDFKQGAARLALKTACPIVPIALQGTEQVWPVGALVPRFHRILHPPRVRVVVGEAITGSQDSQELTRHLDAAISSLLASS